MIYLLIALGAACFVIGGAMIAAFNRCEERNEGRKISGKKENIKIKKITEKV
jgi:hypothetical protein